jgi:hypothetical protein
VTGAPTAPRRRRTVHALRDPAHAVAWVGLGLVLAGFAVLALGWRGVAGTLAVHSQVAYGVSGGVIGLALVGTGLAFLRAHAERLSDAVEDRAWRRVAVEWAALADARRGDGP